MIPLSPPPVREEAPRYFVVRIALLFCAPLVVNGFAMPYFPVWLSTLSLSDFEIGIILAVPMFVRVVTAPLVGLLADRIGERAQVLIWSAVLSLLTALAGQLAVVVENARLHEDVTTLNDDLNELLVSEREKSKQLHAHHEISRTFAQSLSLQTTLEALGDAVVDLLEQTSGKTFAHMVLGDSMHDPARRAEVVAALEGDPGATSALVAAWPDRP